MAEKPVIYLPADPVARIVTMRGQKVILDSDLAAIYGVETKRLNEQIKRNADRFPPDFMFRLTAQETADVASQSATVNAQPSDSQRDETNWSQFATSYRKHRGATYRPYAFTEHGTIMAATVLNSPRAVQMSVFVVRAFIRMRAALADNRELARKLAALEKEIKARLDVHESAIVDTLRRIMEIINRAEGAK